MARRGSTDAQRAVDMAHRNPQRALEIARRAEHPEAPAADRARAAWASGLARRELGDLDGAETDLRRALDHLDGERSVRSRILVSLALVRAFSGDHAEGLRLLAIAEPLAEDLDLGHVRMQRGIILYWTGAINDALASYMAALSVFDGRDPVAEARVHVNAGAALSYAGRWVEALEHLEVGERLAVESRQTLVAATAAHNRAHALALQGDLASAFEAFDRAERRYSRSSTPGGYLDALRLDRAKAYLAGNLLGEALAAARQVATSNVDGASNATAEARYVTAQALLASGDLDGAREAAAASRADFELLGRESWTLLAASLEIGLSAIQSPDSDLIGQAVGAADRFDDLGYGLEASRLRVIAARTAAVVGERRRADALVRGLGRAGVPLTSLDRIAIEQVKAMRGHDDDRPDQVRRAVRRGLRIFADHAVTLGALELRARAAANAERLAALGAELAVRDRRPREFLEFVEAARAPAAALGGAGRAVDPGLAAALSDLRRLVRELGESGPGHDRIELEAERLRAERRAVAIARHTRVEGASAVSVSAAISALGGRDLLEFGVVDGMVFAVSVVRGRSRLHEIGRVDRIEKLAAGVADALHRLNRDRLSDASRAAARAALAEDAGHLGAMLIPSAVRRGGSPVFIVPTGPLHGLAWSTLPALAGRPVSVVPSLLAWARRADDEPFEVRRPLLIGGPDLVTASGEIDRVGAVYDRPVMLHGASASCARVVEALEHADLAHFACHGHFRADNPQFSTLMLADGALTVYDLETCRTLPRAVVLAACDAGANSVLAGGAVLGLSAALVSFGVSRIVAPLNPVSDARSLPVMVDFHGFVRAGHDVDEALAQVVAGADEDEWPVAASFVVVRG